MKQKKPTGSKDKLKEKHMSRNDRRRQETKKKNSLATVRLLAAKASRLNGAIGKPSTTGTVAVHPQEFFKRVPVFCPAEVQNVMVGETLDDFTHNRDVSVGNGGGIFFAKKILSDDECDAWNAGCKKTPPKIWGGFNGHGQGLKYTDAEVLGGDAGMRVLVRLTTRCKKVGLIPQRISDHNTGWPWAAVTSTLLPSKHSKTKTYPMQELHLDDYGYDVKVRDKMNQVRCMWIALDHGCTFGYSPTSRTEDSVILKIQKGAGVIMSTTSTFHFGTSLPKLRLIVNFKTTRNFGGRVITVGGGAPGVTEAQKT